MHTVQKKLTSSGHYLPTYGKIGLRRVPTADNRADLLTKSVKTVIFKKLLDKLKGFDGVAKL